MNQSGRMDKVREYIEAGGYEVVFVTDEAEPERGSQASLVPMDRAAALAEVEEWETRLADWQAKYEERVTSRVGEYAHAVVAAEAEADRLKAALAEYGQHADRCAIFVFVRASHSFKECDCGLAAALAPADRNTT